MVVLAQEEARTTKVGYIGTEHILIGLLQEEDGIAAKILSGMNVTADKVREGILARVHTGSESREGQIPFTPRCQKALELALREALSFGHNYIGTEHVLLGLLREQDGLAAKILREDFALDGAHVRSEVIQTLSGPKAPILKRDKESRPEKPGEPLLDPVNVDDLLSLAITLGRQHPEIPVSRVIAAARALA